MGSILDNPAAAEAQRSAIIASANIEIDQNIAAAKAAALADLEAQYAEKQAQLNEKAQGIQATARELDSQLAGFLTGAIPPMYKTTNANVNIRENLSLSSSPSETVKAGFDIFGLLVIGGLIYLFLKGR